VIHDVTLGKRWVLIEGDESVVGVSEIESE
jgi:hypothetical protein